MDILKNSKNFNPANLNPANLKVDPNEAKERATSFLTEFREFAMKGDVIDLAVGIVIGGAFNKIVQSLVNDIIMPVFGRLLGDSAFTELYVNLSEKEYSTLAEAVLDGAPVIKYGAFITNIIDFIIVAFSIFVVLKIFFRSKKKEEVE